MKRVGWWLLLVWIPFHAGHAVHAAELVSRVLGGQQLANTADYEWWYGCSPTAAGMLIGYYDRNGYGGQSYDNLVPDGVAEPFTFWYADALVNKIIASPGHIHDFYRDGYLATGDDLSVVSRAFDSLADFMGTSQDAFNNANGATTFWYFDDGSQFRFADAEEYLVTGSDGMYGIKEYLQHAGYQVAQLYTQALYDAEEMPSGFTLEDYRTEIDAGRPVIVQLESHSVLGYGYDGNDVLLHDTWAPGEHRMPWGGSYSGLQQWGVVVLELGAPIVPEPSSLMLLGCVAVSVVGAMVRHRRTAMGGTRGSLDEQRAADR